MSKSRDSQNVSTGSHQDAVKNNTQKPPSGTPHGVLTPSSYSTTRIVVKGIKSIFWDNTLYKNILWAGVGIGSCYSTLNYLFFDRVMFTLQTKETAGIKDTLAKAYADILQRQYKQIGMSYASSIAYSIAKNTLILTTKNWVENVMHLVNPTGEQTNRRVASIASGAITTTIVYPMTILKARFFDGQSPEKIKEAFKAQLDGKSLTEQRKLKIQFLYAGFIATIARESIHTLSFYETKHYFDTNLPYFKQLPYYPQGIPDSAVIGVFAGVIAGIAATPASNIAMNQKPTGHNIRTTVVEMWNREQMKAFYKGSLFGSVRLVAAAMIANVAIDYSNLNQKKSS